MGTCPVRNWVSKLACLRLIELVISRNLSEGSDGSICLIFLYLGDFCYHPFVDFLMLELIACYIWSTLVQSLPDSCCHVPRRGRVK